MGRAIDQDTLDSLLREHERRLGILESTSRVSRSSVTDGTFEVRDPTGNVVVTLGKLATASYGLDVRNTPGTWDMAKLTSAGWSAPHLVGAPYDPAASKPITSATFVVTWGVLFGDALGAGIEIQVPWSTDVGVAAEIKVVSNLPSETSVQALADGSSGVAYVRWLHGVTVGTGPLVVQVHARRTGGGGNVNIFGCFGWVRNPESCSTSGTWL